MNPQKNGIANISNSFTSGTKIIVHIRGEVDSRWDHSTFCVRIICALVLYARDRSTVYGRGWEREE